VKKIIPLNEKEKQKLSVKDLNPTSMGTKNFEKFLLPTSLSDHYSKSF
jgi:hypothetical protein